MCLQKKVEASKFKHILDKKASEDDEKMGIEQKDWDKDMNDTFSNEQEMAPADIQELFDRTDDMEKNHALIMFSDGSFSESIGPSKLEKAMKEAEDVDTVIFNGPISDKTLQYLMVAMPSTIVGSSEGKGYEAPDEVDVWLADLHR